MLQPSPMSTTRAFSSRVRCDCSVALILSISALVITVAVVGLPGLGCAYTATEISTAAVGSARSAAFFMVFLLNSQDARERADRTDAILREDGARGAYTRRRAAISRPIAATSAGARTRAAAGKISRSSQAMCGS